MHILYAQFKGPTKNSLQTQAAGGGERKEERPKWREGVRASKNEVSNPNVPLVDPEERVTCLKLIFK